MRRTESTAELAGLIKNYFRPGVKANFPLNAEKFESDIKSGALFTEETASGLFIFKEREDFRIMYFMASDMSALPALDGKTVCEIPYRAGKRDAVIEDAFRIAGFENVLERVRLTRGVASADMPDDGELDVHRAGEGDAEKAYGLFSDCFSRYTGCLPTPDDLKNDAEAGKLICAFKGGELIAALHSDNEKKTAEIRHLAVREDVRGRGIAGIITKYYLNTVNGMRCTVWTGRDNSAAIKNYENCGFEPDGYMSCVMMKG